MKTISLCMIVKDEAEILGETLARIRNYMQEIIIVDTGSSDDTIEIASQFTDKVYHFDWCDDFSKARNFANSLATCDFILNLDADELVVNTDFFISFQEYNDKSFVGHQINCVCEQNRKFNFEYYKKNVNTVNESGRVILFKNYEGYYYEGIIHEYLVDSDGKKIVDASEWMLTVINITQPQKQIFKYRFYNNLCEKQLEIGELKENTANLSTNLLDYFSTYGQYEKFDELFTKFKNNLLDSFNRRDYIRLIHKLFKKNQFRRTKILIDLYRRFIYKDNTFMSETYEVEDSRWNRQFYFITDEITSLKCWEEKINKVLTKKSNSQLLILVIDLRNFKTINLSLEAIKFAFYKGIDLFEINYSFDCGSFNIDVYNYLSIYPVICKLSDFDKKPFEFLEEYIKLAGQKINDLYLIINSTIFECEAVKNLIVQYSHLVKTFIIQLVITYDMSSKELFNLVETFKRFSNDLNTFAKDNNIMLLFEGFPLCLILKSDMVYLSDLRWGAYMESDMETGGFSICNNCFLKENCFINCHDNINHEFKTLLSPISNLVDIYKFKSMSRIILKMY